MFQYFGLFGILLMSGSIPAAEESLRLATSGFKVVVDPATGEIIDQPTEADLEVLAEGERLVRRRSSWDLEAFGIATGGTGVFLDGWADHSLEVVRGADGRLTVACSRGDDHSPLDRTDEEGASTEDGGGPSRPGVAIR